MSRVPAFYMSWVEHIHCRCRLEYDRS